MVPSDMASDAGEFQRVFAAEAGDAPVPFARFMELALYHPRVGYYRRPRKRVGFSSAADFSTAASAGPVFGELAAAAARALIAPAEPGEFAFVEIGAEPDMNVLDGVAHGFGGVGVIRIDDDLRVAGRCVVFSNELFDAQPFHRLRWRGGAWRETGVALRHDAFTAIELSELSSPVRTVAGRLPTAASEGYCLDLPLAAADLCARIAAQPWTGLFLAFDFGKTWRQLTEETPAGTARAYRRQRQHDDLLAHPGEQDLTCHVCWDWLEAALLDAGFAQPRLESQEAFLLHHAASTAAAIVAAAPSGPDPRRSRLHQLLHPALQGQRFQALWATRPPRGND